MSTYNPAPYQDLSTICLEAFQSEEGLTPFDLAERMMDADSVLMHCPAHHFIVPAALITAARRAQAASEQQLEADLKLAAQRASKVPGGFCGWWGCCGAAVGGGVFASILLDASPKQQEHWALVNQFTARCLDKVASVEGPRCCKRVTYLALAAAMERAPSLLGVDLGEVPPVLCSRFALNDECKGTECPYYPA